MESRSTMRWQATLWPVDFRIADVQVATVRRREARQRKENLGPASLPDWQHCYAAETVSWKCLRPTANAVLLTTRARPNVVFAVAPTDRRKSQNASSAAVKPTPAQPR
jgi:hypothetical protein